MEMDRFRGESTRRTVLKQVGLTSVGATVGLSQTTGAVTDGGSDDLVGDSNDGAGPEYDHVVAISDLHWSSPATYVDGDSEGTTREQAGSVTFDSQLFLEEKFFANHNPKGDGQRPDALLLVGDIMELWWRGLSSALVESSRPLDMLRRLNEAGTDVYLIAGNHDYWLLENDDQGPMSPPQPWRFREELFFQSGDREFVAIHGHQADPLNFNPVTNQAFCIGDDQLSYIAYEVWTSGSGAVLESDADVQRWEESVDEFSTEYYTVPQEPLVDGQLPLVADLGDARVASNSTVEGDVHSSLAGALGDTEVESNGTIADVPPVDPTDPKQFVEDRVAEMYDEYTVFGHTHRPVQTDGYVNCGAWTARGTDDVRDRTYVEIHDGAVSLWDWNPDGSDERIDPE